MSNICFQQIIYDSSEVKTTVNRLIFFKCLGSFTRDRKDYFYIDACQRQGVVIIDSRGVVSLVKNNKVKFNYGVRHWQSRR